MENLFQPEEGIYIRLYPSFTSWMESCGRALFIGLRIHSPRPKAQDMENYTPNLTTQLVACSSWHFGIDYTMYTLHFMFMVGSHSIAIESRQNGILSLSPVGSKSVLCLVSTIKVGGPNSVTYI